MEGHINASFQGKRIKFQLFGSKLTLRRDKKKGKKRIGKGKKRIPSKGEKYCRRKET